MRRTPTVHDGPELEHLSHKLVTTEVRTFELRVTSVEREVADCGSVVRPTKERSLYGVYVHVDGGQRVGRYDAALPASNAIFKTLAKQPPAFLL